MALKSQQARQIRRRLYARLVVLLALFTMFYAVFCDVFEKDVTPRIAEEIADTGWQTLTQEQFDLFQDSMDMSDWQVIPQREEPEDVGDEAVDEDDVALPAEDEGATAVDWVTSSDMQAYATDIADAVKNAYPFDAGELWGNVDVAMYDDYAFEDDGTVRASDGTLYRIDYYSAALSLGAHLADSNDYITARDWVINYFLTLAASQGIDEELTQYMVFDYVLGYSYDEASPGAEIWESGVPVIGEKTNDTDTIDTASYVYMVRDISLYNRLKPLKYVGAVVLYFLGVSIIILLTINRAVRYFDKLAGAVGALVAGKDAEEALPRELSLVAGELTEVRARAQADERAAAAAEARKNELVAYLAHDIKTPLTSVLGYLDLLENAEDMPAATQRHYAAVAHEKAERLDGLIDEFFEITRYNLSAIPIERTHVDARLFLEQLADEFFPEAAAHNLTLQVECTPAARLYIDPDKMARALSNVIRNAVAYADAGTIIHIDCGQAGAGWLLSVTNYGREISEAHLQSIFEKFYRTDEARATAKGGAGLGLAIAREIVTAHGGTITAASVGGKTTFTIELP